MLHSFQRIDTDTKYSCYFNVSVKDRLPGATLRIVPKNMVENRIVSRVSMTNSIIFVRLVSLVFLHDALHLVFQYKRFIAWVREIVYNTAGFCE